MCPPLIKVWKVKPREHLSEVLIIGLVVTTDDEGQRGHGAESEPGHCHDVTRGLMTWSDVTTAFIHQQHNNIDLTQQQ